MLIPNTGIRSTPITRKLSFLATRNSIGRRRPLGVARSNSSSGAAFVAHAGTAAVLVDELDLCRFESAADCQIICARQRCLALLQFSATDRGDA